jgi:hypothetical protein
LSPGSAAPSDPAQGLAASPCSYSLCCQRSTAFRARRPENSKNSATAELQIRPCRKKGGWHLFGKGGWHLFLLLASNPSPIWPGFADVFAKVAGTFPGKVAGTFFGLLIVLIN